MKVCEELVDYAERLAWVDKDLSFGASGIYERAFCLPTCRRESCGRLFRGVLEGANYRCADG
jgi:hypothetical protein